MKTIYKVHRNGLKTFKLLNDSFLKAKKSIYINMFIWRNDPIGLMLLKTIEQKAKEGIEITINKDRYGAICEMSEESGSSIFHSELSFSERFKIGTLKYFYRNKIIKNNNRECDEVLNNLIKMPNVIINNKYFYDHSKFVIIDNKIIFLGGINFEQKEAEKDLKGRFYQDYYIEIHNQELALSLLNKKPSNEFVWNDNKVKAFNIKNNYLEIINSAQKNLTIVMPYFSNCRQINKAILKASRRGVKVRILIPERPNFQKNLNYRTVEKLRKKSNGEILILLNPKINHTKFIANESSISIGSCNITKKAFNQLGELNFICDKQSKIGKEISTMIEEDISNSYISYKKLDYDPAFAFFESLIV